MGCGKSKSKPADMAVPPPEEPSPKVADAGVTQDELVQGGSGSVPSAGASGSKEDSASSSSEDIPADGFPEVNYTPEMFPIPPESEPVELSNKIVYTGGWFNGKQSGFGEMKFPDGGRYVGEYKEGVAAGKGIFYGTNGSVYMGKFENNRANGYGKYFFKDGAEYLGNFVDDARVGLGKETLPDGTTYIGSFLHGSKSGFGFLRSNSELYIGEFLEGDISGFGQYSWSDSRTYVGYWQLSKQHGMGFFYWPEPNKRTFAGRYRDGIIGGHGALWWADGRVYIGAWSNGLQAGKAIYYLDEEHRRFASFLEGVRTRWEGEVEPVTEETYPPVPVREIIEMEATRDNIGKIEAALADVKSRVDELPEGPTKDPRMPKVYA